MTAAATAAPARKAAVRTPSSPIESSARAHPAGGKLARASGPASARLSRVPERAVEVKSPHRETAHSSPRAEGHAEARTKERTGVGRAAGSRSEPPAKLRGSRETAVRGERGRETAEAARHSELTSARTPAKAVARVEPEKMVHVSPAPARVAREAPAPAAAKIESDPEAAKVVHDRKIHRTGEGGAAEDSAEPRKATPSDFMTEPSAKPAESAPPAKPAAAEITRPKAAPMGKAAAAEPAPAPVNVAVVYRGGRLVVPPALKGSHEILLHQNEMADADGLGRVQDDGDLEAMREARLLVPIPAEQGLHVDERLPANRRYTRPWTAQFLAALARAHYQRFHTALQVNSAVRTVEFQQRLLLTNGNAAPAEGETASPHLTGQAVDLAKKGLTLTEIAWLRGYLLPLVQQGKVDVEEEFQQACFHVSVYRKYLPEPEPKRVIAQHRIGASALATALP